jgi:polyribonucleotide nucleotidyltransferase
LCVLRQLNEKNIAQYFIKCFSIRSRKKRLDLINKIYSQELKKFSSSSGSKKSIFDIGFKKFKKEIFKKIIIQNNVRIDGREFNEIREINAKVNLLPKTHGSSLFTRGDTQALSIVTLGSKQDMQTIDNVTGVEHQHFTLHYNFPSYSVGECSQLKPPTRREIGHGNLAIQSLKAVMPLQSDFFYTIRVVSEITESNGSSSMATVCAASMALMQAGVPIQRSVSGIAMGLISANKSHVILSDISADEDGLGDMDFKVASTCKGITSLQMDLKISGVTIETIEKVIDKALKGNHAIRHKMSCIINEPNKEINDNAPQLHTMSINNTNIKDLIGPNGRVIKDICEKSGAKIDIDQNGKILIFCLTRDSLKVAIDMINNVIIEPVVNQEYSGEITSIKNFGIFVRFFKSKEGLVHNSEFNSYSRDNFREGNKIKIKYLGLSKGRYRITINDVKQLI